MLQFFSYEEGRIRPQRNSAGVVTGVYYYDYFIKDHLGNTRMVLTDEKQIDAYPVASLEAATINSEKTYYDIPDASRIATSEVPGYPVSGTSNAWVQRLNGNGQKTGPSIVLRVMSGDKVSISADSWYASGVTPGIPSNLSVADLIASLAGGIAGSGGASHSVAQIRQNPNLQSGLGSFLTNVVNADNAANGNLPKSYLNYVLFDEQLNVVITNDGKNSGIDRVGSGGALKLHQITQRPITRNGYLYIYVSNETPGLNVIFDNLKVTHVRGELTEETHYYPFGLTMAGISSKAAGKLQNRFMYSGKELQSNEFGEESGLELYDFGARMQDPQLGRWWAMDPLVDKMWRWSPYNYAFNNPLRFIDPEGMAPFDWIKNKANNNYEWRNGVTQANTPSGYSYVGQNDNDIVKDLGYSTNPVTVSTTKMGVIHTDVEEGDANKSMLGYTAGHALSINITTTIAVSADVTTIVDDKLNVSKTFNGLQEGISMVVRSSSGEKLTTTAEVKFDGASSSNNFYLGEPAPSPGFDVKEAGASYLRGAVSLTPERAKRGDAFPGLSISGTFFRGTNDGPAYVMPNVLSGQLNVFAPLKYEQTLPSIHPKR